MPSLQESTKIIIDNKSQIKSKIAMSPETKIDYEKTANLLDKSNYTALTTKDITKMYRQLSLFIHPDKMGITGEESVYLTPFKLLGEAKAVLEDPKATHEEKQDAYFSLHFLYCFVCGLNLPPEPRPHQPQPQQYTSSYTQPKRRTNTSSNQSNANQSGTYDNKKKPSSSNSQQYKQQYREQQRPNSLFDSVYNAIYTFVNLNYSSTRDKLLTDQILNLQHTYFPEQTSESIAQQFAIYILNQHNQEESSRTVYECFCEKLHVSISKQLLDATNINLQDFYISALLQKTMLEKGCTYEFQGLYYLLDDLIQEHGTNADTRTMEKFCALDRILCQWDRSEQKLFSDAATFADTYKTFGPIHAEILRRRLNREDLYDKLLDCIYFIKPTGFKRLIEAFSTETESLKKILIDIVNKLKSIPSNKRSVVLTTNWRNLLKEIFIATLKLLDSASINHILQQLSNKGYIEPPLYGLVILLQLPQTLKRDMAVISYNEQLENYGYANTQLDLHYWDPDIGPSIAREFEKIIQENQQRQRQQEELKRQHQQELKRQKTLLNSGEMISRDGVENSEMKERIELKARYEELQELLNLKQKEQAQELLNRTESMQRLNAEELENKDRKELEAQYKELQELLKSKKKEQKQKINLSDLLQQINSSRFQELNKTSSPNSDPNARSRKSSPSSSPVDSEFNSPSPGNSSSPTSKPNKDDLLLELLLMMDNQSTPTDEQLQNLKKLEVEEDAARQDITNKQLSERKLLEESLLIQWKNAITGTESQHTAGASSGEMSETIREIFKENPDIIDQRAEQDPNGYISALKAAYTKYQEQVTEAKKLQSDIEEEKAVLGVFRTQDYHFDNTLIEMKKLLDPPHDLTKLTSDIEQLLKEKGLKATSAPIFARKLLREREQHKNIDSSSINTLIRTLNKKSNYVQKAINMANSQNSTKKPKQ